MFRKSILLNLLAILCVGLSGFFLLVWGLDYYTRHDVTVTIPELRGKHLGRAIAMLDDVGLRYEVVDSVYDKRATPGTVLEAYPSSGEVVKPQRIIFLKIYATSPPKLAVPYVKDMSARQAFALLRALGFEYISQKIVAGEYKGLCQGISLDGGSVLKAGDLINKDTPLVLLVTGDVLSDSIRIDDLLLEGEGEEALSTDSTSHQAEPRPKAPKPDNEPENWW